MTVIVGEGRKEESGAVYFFRAWAMYIYIWEFFVFVEYSGGLGRRAVDVL